MGWGALGEIADSAKGIVDGAVDVIDDAGRAFGDALDSAEGAARSVGQAVSNASISDIGHMSLDGLGMVPVIGEAADIANALWYTAEGDYTNAAFSAGAAIPFVGNAATAAKWGKKEVDAADMTTDAAKAADIAGDTAKVAGEAADMSKIDALSRPQILFGQKRVGQSFGVEGRPSQLAGRSIEDVASDLRSGRLHPDDVPIDAFRYGDSLVSTNSRSLAALSEAGLSPTNVQVVEPTRAHLARLRETPIISDAPLPGNRVPVTPSQNDLTVLKVIETPRR